MPGPKWKRYYRIASPGSYLEARRSPGGEPYGLPDFGRLTNPGQWLCRNPDNDWRWVCADDTFEALYCEEGVFRLVNAEKPSELFRLRLGKSKGKK